MGASETDDEEEDTIFDGHYLGARVLGYQLLHSPLTRSNNSIPFLVLTTPNISSRKRGRLAADGAIVIVADTFKIEVEQPIDEYARYKLSQLHLFELTQFKKICFINPGTLITDSLDGVFDDAATELSRAQEEGGGAGEDETLLPGSYMFAGKPDALDYAHDIPLPGDAESLDNGFFVFSPDKQLYRYYSSLLKLPGRFDMTHPFASLLRYAHRKDGNMPWSQLSWRWNMNWPTLKDLEGGARSFHANFWNDDPTHDENLKNLWELQRVEMEGYYRGMDDALAQQS